MREAITFWFGLLLAVFACLVWALIALLLGFVVPQPHARHMGRAGASYGFRFIAWLAGALGIYELDLRELDELRGASPMLLAPNHPTLMDAPFVISRLPGVVCVMKGRLRNSILLGASARLARYIVNDSPRRMIRDSVRELHEGAHVLLFPEGTRTPPGRHVGALKAAGAIIASRAQVPVQTLIIATDSPYMSKGWSPTRRPSWPIRFSIRLGRRFEAQDAGQLLAQLEQYFDGELRTQPLPLQKAS